MIGVDEKSPTSLVHAWRDSPDFGIKVLFDCFVGSTAHDDVRVNQFNLFTYKDCVACSGVLHGFSSSSAPGGLFQVNEGTGE